MNIFCLALNMPLVSTVCWLVYINNIFSMFSVFFLICHQSIPLTVHDIICFTFMLQSKTLCDKKDRIWGKQRPRTEWQLVLILPRVEIPAALLNANPMCAYATHSNSSVPCNCFEKKYNRTCVSNLTFGVRQIVTRGS